MSGEAAQIAAGRSKTVIRGRVWGRFACMVIGLVIYAVGRLTITGSLPVGFDGLFYGMLTACVIFYFDPPETVQITKVNRAHLIGEQS